MGRATLGQFVVDGLAVPRARPRRFRMGGGFELRGGGVGPIGRHFFRRLHLRAGESVGVEFRGERDEPVLRVVAHGHLDLLHEPLLFRVLWVGSVGSVR